MFSEINIWSFYPHQLLSTPDFIWSYTSGVLQMASRNGDLEHSRCPFWSAYYTLTLDLCTTWYVRHGYPPRNDLNFESQAACSRNNSLKKLI